MSREYCKACGLLWGHTNECIRKPPVAAPCAGCAELERCMRMRDAHNIVLRTQRLALEQAIDAAVVELDNAAGPNFIGRALSALRAARGSR